MSPDILGEALGAVSLALLIVYVVIKEVVVKKANNTNEKTAVDHPFYCQAGKYETRITKLESRCASNDDNIHRLEQKIDRNSVKIDQAVENLSQVKMDVSLVLQAVEWIKADRKSNGR